MPEKPDIPVPAWEDFVEHDIREFLEEDARRKALEASTFEADSNPYDQQYDGVQKKGRRGKKNASNGDLQAELKIKRFVNAYAVFLDFRTTDTKLAHPNLSIPEVWKYLAAEWKGMSTKEKAFYDDEYRKRKELFELEYPDYDPKTARKIAPTTTRATNQASPTSSFSSGIGAFSPPPTPSTGAGSPPPRRRYHTKRRQGRDQDHFKDDWNGLKFRKKPEGSFVLDENPNTPFYSPIGVKADLPSPTTLFPVSRPPIQPSRAFWEMPVRRHNAKPQVPYTRKPFFKPRTASGPIRRKYVECAYCRSLGHSGGRINHLEENCRTKPRHQTQNSGGRQGKPSSKGKPRSRGRDASSSFRPTSVGRHSIPLITITAPSSSFEEDSYPAPPTTKRYFTQTTFSPDNSDNFEIEEGEIDEAGQLLVDAGSWFDAFGDIGIPDVKPESGMDIDMTASFDAFDEIMRAAEGDDSGYIPV